MVSLIALLHWCILGGGDASLGLSLARFLGLFWEKRSHLSEGRVWLEQALAHHPGADAGLRAATLNFLGVLAYAQGDTDRAQEVYQESLALRRVVGDPIDIGQSLTNLGNVSVAVADYEQAVTWYEESLAIAERHGNTAGRATVLNNLGVVARAQGDQARALILYEECYQIHQELGDIWRAAVTLANLGSVTSALGELERAQDLYRASLSVRRDLGDRQGIVLTLLGLGHLAHRQDLDERAAHLPAAGAVLGGRLGVALPSSGLAEHERIIQEIHQGLGDQEYAVAWAAGEAMTMERAVEYGLGDIGPKDPRCVDVRLPTIE